LTQTETYCYASSRRIFYSANMEQKKIIIDGLVWLYPGEFYKVDPICPKHNLRLYPSISPHLERGEFGIILQKTQFLFCEDCNKYFELKRDFDRQIRYVVDRIDSKNFKTLKTINLDDEAIPLAEGKNKNKDYFIVAKLTESKVGQRLVVYAGKKGEKGKEAKSQIFIEPDIKRLSFDHKDLNPNDIFIKFEATFKDGAKWTMK
jgi:hypothetical protein